MDENCTAPPASEQRCKANVLEIIPRYLEFCNNVEMQVNCICTRLTIKNPKGNKRIKRFHHYHHVACVLWHFKKVHSRTNFAVFDLRVKICKIKIGELFYKDPIYFGQYFYRSESWQRLINLSTPLKKENRV